MKINRLSFLMFLYLILPLVGLSQSKIISLNLGWSFNNVDSNFWAPANVPGSIFTDLIKLNRIPNPLIADNESKVQWVSESGWCYRLKFLINAEDLANYRKANLLFEELDTYAYIFLNDSLIHEAHNMFVSHQIEVRKWLKAGKNELKVIFPPMLPLLRESAKKLPYKLPENERVFARKPQFQFGWDWAPKIINMGISKSVSLTFWNSLDVEQPTIVTSLKNNAGIVHCSLPVEVAVSKSSILTVDISNQKSGLKYFTQKFSVSSDSLLKFNFSINNPKIWNPTGSGQPNIYHLLLTVTDSKSTTKTYHKQIGFRNINLVQTPDSIGRSFYFEVNGQPVFAKGANWTPIGIFKNENSPQKYRKLLTMAHNAGYNMLRVWGGGGYEDDIFYDLCDSLGIMVWQDAMFASAMYPYDDVFLKSVYAEINFQSKRLSSHPSIALWCGNNENYEGWANWGWQKQYGYSAADSTSIWSGNRKLFETVIPQALKESYGNVFFNYHPSSPANGWGRDTAYKTGDVHYWGVWWGMEPFSSYRKKVGRFVSEYGFQGYPSIMTLEQAANQAIDSLNQPSLATHQKHSRGYQTIDEYLQRDYPKPKSVEDYVYISQLMQADGMGEAIKAHTQRVPYCMGSLYWQFSDCWPSISWSALDYFGNPKSFYFASKRLFKPVKPTFMKNGDTTEIWVSNIGNKSFRGTVMLIEIEQSGVKKIIGTTPVSITSNNSSVISILSNSHIKPNSVFAAVLVDLQGKEIAEEVCFVNQPKKLTLKKPFFTFHIIKEANGFTKFVISSDVPVKGLWLTIDGFELSENGFDMIPRKDYVIDCTPEKPNTILKSSSIKTISLNDVLNR
ncbi:MAG: glycoside hydrolase family 2 protein [Bacteroidota bacterium]